MKCLNILITGGSGFIGSHLVDRLCHQHRLTVIDNLSAGNQNRPRPPVKFYQTDICRPQIIGLLQKIKPQVVFHLAADNQVTSGPEVTLKSNVIGTFNVLKAAQEAKVKQFVFTSSAAVYGEPESLPIKETHPTRPISSYGISKLTGELYCQQFQSDMITSVFRFANVYGPRQSSHSEGGVVAIFIKHLLSGTKPIIYGNGRQTRDFVYVDDVVDALVLSLEKPQSFLVNIGSGQTTGILELLNLTAQLMQTRPVFRQKPARPMEITASLFSYSLAKKILDWQPKTSLESGLRQTINTIRSNLAEQQGWTLRDLKI